MKSGVFCLQAACPGRLQSQTQASCRAAPAAPRAQPPSARPALGRRTGPAALRAKKASASPAPAVDWEAEAEALRASQTKAAQGSEEDETSKLKQATQTIRRLGREGDAIGAVAALADLGKAGIQPDIVAVTTTIGACVDNNDIPRAMRVFDEIVGARPPSPKASPAASVAVTRRLHSETRSAGVVAPDEMLFSVLLRAHGRRKPPAWGEVSALLGKMRNTFGITAGITTYNALLDVCADTNDYDRGCQLIDRMEQEGVEPDQGTIAAVAKRRSLRAYLKRLTG